ncbi:MAG: PD-(D/E)XK nuclease family protein [Bacteroidota bacterium]
MKTFLQETVENIIQKFGKDLENIQIIFPNKRTGYFFQTAFAKAMNKTVWSPKTYTIQSYISKLSRIQKVDKIALIFILYDSFKAIDPEFNMSFDTFFGLGELILNDFNEVDSYLVDVDQIFTNIKNIHEIDQKYGDLTEEQIAIIKQYWLNFSVEDMSREKAKFIELWNILPAVYKHFKNTLLSKNLAYEGLIYRSIADQLTNGNLQDGDEVLLFIGFNALNAAQKKLFKYLKNKGKAYFYWDTDAYYFKNQIQEAGDFLRVNFEVLDEAKEKIPANFNTPGKKINLFGVPGNVGQAKVITEILKKHKNWEQIKNKPDKTVIVLTDESMLFPVLHSLPDEIETFNITMGYPLNDTALFSLIMYFLRIQQTMTKQTDGKSVFYYKEVQAILNHPYIYPSHQETAQQILDTINNQQLNYVNQDLLLRDKEKLYELIFTTVSEENQAGGLLTKLLNILFIVFNKLPKDKKGSVEEEYIYQTYITVKRLNEVIEKHAQQIDLNKEITSQLLKQLLSGIRVPFESQSTDGMQIMGLIETRNVDFDNVILLNANEGILPNLNRAPSLISESMRHAFGLPVLKYQDAIFAYFFYRLLQRAKNINIVYNNLSGTSLSGELSRFVQQVKLESGIDFQEFQLDQHLETAHKQEILIEKDEKVQEILSDYFVEGNVAKKQLTATALDSYLSCSLKFYFRYIARIKEVDKVEEEFSPVDLGIIIHSVMELIYKSIIKKNNSSLIQKKDIKTVYDLIEGFITEAFKEYYGKSNSPDFKFTGNLLVIKEVIHKYIKTILKVDEKQTPFEIVQLEEDHSFQTTFSFNHDGEEKQIGLKGIIDRIDKKNGIYRLIDYKTGKAEKDFSDYLQLFQPLIRKRKKAIFQLFIYGILFKKHEDYKGKPFTPGIYDLRDMHKADFNASIYWGKNKNRTIVNDHNFKGLIEDFESYLSEKLTELFNPEIPFVQTEFEENCTYCPYKVICSKE